MRNRTAAWLAFGISLAFAITSAAPVSPAAARTVADVFLPDSVRTEQGLLELNGSAVYKKLGVRVLVAGLWLERRESDAEMVLATDAPRRYVTHFVHSVKSKRIRDAWMNGLEANTPHASGEVHDQFKLLCSWVRDFKPGDEITLTYLPGLGSAVEISGAPKGMIPGKGFADAYFALALGPHPGLGDACKRQLLGGR